MYTLEQLQQRTFKELKEIGWQLNVLPSADRRCRQNWIDALVGINPPLLKLLETSPAAEVESVEEAIEIQRQEPIEIQRQEPIEIQPQEPIEYGRITGYLCRPNSPIALAIKKTTPGEANGNTPETDRLADLRANSHYRRIDTAKPDGGSGGIESSTLANQESNRLLAAAGDSQRGQWRALPYQLHELAIAILNDEQPPNRGDGRGGRLEQAPVTFSDQFLATYPPYFGEVRYKADDTGQLKLLEPDIKDEPPDPDDFDSINAFQKAIAVWDAEHPEPPEVSLASMCEWAKSPDEWFSPETVETVSCTLESSGTSNFSIPVFGVAGDRTNRNSDEPPTAGVGARLPRPKPPSFPPAVVLAGDRSSIEKFARRAILLSGRSPPGGDAAHSP